MLGKNQEVASAPLGRFHFRHRSRRTAKTFLEGYLFGGANYKLVQLRVRCHPVRRANMGRSHFQPEQAK